MTTKTTKTIKKKSAVPQTDVFTALCKQRLGVVVCKEFKFHPSRRWRFDYAITENKIAIEVEGGVWTQGRHIRPKGFIGDMEKYNTAASLGWRILRFTPDDLLSFETLNTIKTTMQSTS